MGRLLHPSTGVDWDLCREPGGTFVPVYRETRVGGAARDDHWSV